MTEVAFAFFVGLVIGAVGARASVTDDTPHRGAGGGKMLP